MSAIFATHYHADHVGGEPRWPRRRSPASSSCSRRIDVPIHVQADEVEWVTKRTGVGEDSLVAHDAGDVVAVGDFEVSLIHTPGHTPGSQCLLVNGLLDQWRHAVPRRLRSHRPAGLGPARDVPHVDPASRRTVSDDTVLYPGHLYSADPSAPMGDVRQHNRALVPASAEQWLAMFSR